MPTALSFITDYVRAVHLDRRRAALWPDIGAPLVHGEQTVAFDAELAAARAMGPAAYRAKFKQVAAYMGELATSPEAVSKLARRFRTAPSVATAVSSSSAARNGLSLARAADGTAIPPAACDHPPLQHLHPVSDRLAPHGTEETTDACQGRGRVCRERGTVCQGLGTVCQGRGNECHG